MLPACLPLWMKDERCEKKFWSVLHSRNTSSGSFLLSFQIHALANIQFLVQVFFYQSLASYRACDSNPWPKNYPIEWQTCYHCASKYTQPRNNKVFYLIQYIIWTLSLKYLSCSKTHPERVTWYNIYGRRPKTKLLWVWIPDGTFINFIRCKNCLAV